MNKEPAIVVVSVALRVFISVEIITAMSIVSIGGEVDISLSHPYGESSVIPPIGIPTSLTPGQTTKQIPIIFVTCVFSPAIETIFFCTQCIIENIVSRFIVGFTSVDGYGFSFIDIIRYQFFGC